MLPPEEQETSEILADHDLLESMARAEKDIKAGRLYTAEEIFDQ